jgi:hypothetical protein
MSNAWILTEIALAGCSIGFGYMSKCYDVGGCELLLGLFQMMFSTLAEAQYTSNKSRLIEAVRFIHPLMTGFVMSMCAIFVNQGGTVWRWPFLSVHLALFSSAVLRAIKTKPPPEPEREQGYTIHIQPYA